MKKTPACILRAFSSAMTNLKIALQKSCLSNQRIWPPFEAFCRLSLNLSKVNKFGYKKIAVCFAKHYWITN